MKNNYIKTAGIGVLAILIYFILPMLETVPFKVVGIDPSTLALTPKIIYMIAYETIILSLIVVLLPCLSVTVAIIV